MYFEKESLQNNIGDDLDKRNRNFEKIESDITMMGTNLITNGDFSNGATGWVGSVTYSTISASGGVLNVTSKSTGWNIAQQTNIGTHKSGNKLYVRAKMKNATGGTSLSIRKGLGSTELASVTNIVANTWYTLVGIWDTAGYSGAIGLRFDKYGETVAGDVISIQYVQCIDLTQTFGAGNEPTVEQMDEIMSKFENSWFDGTKNLFRANATLNKLMALGNEKANKVQEAWITPTLLNGWVAFDANRVPKYMKDEFGFVHFQGMVKSGTIGQSIFSLPAGYRPGGTRFMAITSNNSFGQLFVDTYGVVLPQIGSNNWLSLDQIVFKAEV